MPLRALVVVSVPLALVVATAGVARAQGDAALERARIQLQSGRVYFERGDYRRAIEQFQSADELKPAAAISYNIARAYERWAQQIGDPIERAEKLRAAAQNLRKYLERDPKATDRAEVLARIAEIERSLPPTVRIESQPAGALVRIDDPRGPLRGKTPLVVGIEPGKHTLYLEVPGSRPVERPFVVAPAPHDAPPALVSAALEPKGASRATTTAVRTGEKRPLSGMAITGWTLGSIGVALAVGGIALGVQTLRKKSDFDACNRATPGAPACTTLQNDGRTFQHATDGLLWPGLALAATGAVLLIVDARQARAERAGATSSAERPRFGPLVGGGTYGLEARLGF